jgi:hypothetical protein
MISQELLSQIEADIEEQQANQTTLQIAQTVPYALLRVLGAVLGNMDEEKEVKLPATEVEFIADTLQAVLNLLGWSVVITKQDSDGSCIVALVPLGTEEPLGANESEEVGV